MTAEELITARDRVITHSEALLSFNQFILEPGKLAERHMCVGETGVSTDKVGRD